MQQENNGPQATSDGLQEHWDDLFEPDMNDVHLRGVALSRSSRPRELRRNEHLAGLWDALGLGD